MLNHVGTIQLETNRLVLRRHEISDAADMYKNWVTDFEVSRFWQWKPHKNIEETKLLLSQWVEQYEKPDYYHWIIVLKSISQAIGYIYLADIDDINNSVSVHFALSKKYWNQGIMTEACSCILKFAFDIMRAEKVRSEHHIDNPASGKVLKKCGMHCIGTAYKQAEAGDRHSGSYSRYEIKSSNRI